jgi:hypothetical protein
MLLRDATGGLVRGPAMLSEPVTQNSAQLNIEFMAGTEWMNEMVMVLSGQAPEGTADVAVVGQESEDFSASVNSAGQFAVWWPSASGQVTGRVVARDAEGNELASLQLGDYYHCADNIHYYEAHFDLASKILQETPRDPTYFLLKESMFFCKDGQFLLLPPGQNFLKDVNELLQQRSESSLKRDEALSLIKKYFWLQ